MTEDTKNKIKGKFNEIKSNIETFISDVNVTELKASFNTMVKDAQRDFNKILDKDLDVVKKKLQKEKEDIEIKAKKFLENHKKELDSLQVKFDKLVRATKGKAKEAAAPTMKKKAVRKAAKKDPPVAVRASITGDLCVI